MKRMLLPPIFVLAALLAFSLWNIRHMEGETDRWREQLQGADRLALSGEWAEALDALWESYDDWSHSQTYLHIVSHHDAVDDAEAMYRRAIAFGETEELSEFHAELSDLRDQLRLIAEMEALKAICNPGSAYSSAAFHWIGPSGESPKKRHRPSRKLANSYFL